MMAAYPYQQNDAGGASVGYVRYSVRPALGAGVAPGETIAVSGQVYHRTRAHECIELALTVNGRSFYVRVNQSFPRGRVTGFNLTCPVTPEMAAAVGEGRTAALELRFTLWRGRDAGGAGDALVPTSAQALTLLKYRLRPVIDQARFGRCREGDDGWEAHDEGFYARAEALEISIAPEAKASDISVCRLEYQDAAGETQTLDLDPQALLAGVSEREPGLLAGVRFLLGRDHLLTLVVGDAYDAARAVSVLPRAFANFHQSGAAKGGAAFGMFSGATDSEPMLESAWPFYAYGGVYGADGARLDTVREHTVTQFSSAFAAYSAGYVPRALRAGRLVQLGGACTPLRAIAGSTSEELMFSLPRVFWPKETINQLCQGSNGATWLMRVSTGGLVTMSRYRNGAAYDTAEPGYWLPFHALWIASDYAGPAAVRRPVKAMRSNADRGCVASASSRAGAAYAAWKGFDYRELTGWVSQAADAHPWLQLQMDAALTELVVEVYARDASGVNNPTAGRVLGSLDGESWVELASFSGWSGAQSGALLGEVRCGNATAYNYVRLAVDERGRNGVGVGVGYMTVRGVLPEE